MKYSTEEKLQAVLEVVSNHRGIKSVAREFGIHHEHLRHWVVRYEKSGQYGLVHKNETYSREFKLSVLNYMRQNRLSLFDTAVYFDIPSSSTVYKWDRLYRECGIEAISSTKRGRKPIMSIRKSDKKKPALAQSPSDVLLAENERLRAEVAYLKKLRALVEERIGLRYY